MMTKTDNIEGNEQLEMKKIIKQHNTNREQDENNM